MNADHGASTVPPIDPSDRGQLNLLQASLDHINQGFSLFDADLRLVAANRRLFSLLDFPIELAAPGTHLSEFLRVNASRGEYGPGDIEEHVARRVARAKLFEPHSFERVRPNGQVVLITGAPLPQGGFVTTYTDVTLERRHQDKLERTVVERTRALRQSEDWLRLVTDNVPALVAYLAPGPVYRFANRRYAKWFDQTVASIVGRSPREVVGEQLYRTIEPHLERAFEGHAVTYEYSRARHDGRMVHMRSTLIPDRTVDGRTLGCFVLSLDVTEQKRSEATLAQAQRMEAVHQLSGGLAHDFNNLLTIIIGNVLALRRRADVPAMPDLSAHLDPILQAAQRGADLTRRLLAFARGDGLVTGPQRLAPLFANVATLLSGSLPKTIDLAIGPVDATLEARVDPNEFENALVNLAFNARDAMPGGGRLNIALERNTLDERAAEAQGLPPGLYAEITVTDTGVGMDAETLRQAFDPFFSTKPFGTGSGLGLPTVYGLARRSGGKAEIESTLGTGTVIRLMLPATISALAGEAEPAAPPKTIGDGELILLVDDDANVADVIRDQLCALGFTVLVTTSAEDALQLVREVPEIRAMLSDIVMPGGMDGLALVEAARAARPELPVALMSGYRGGQPTVELPCPVLAKPFTTRMLADVTSEILAR